MFGKNYEILIKIDSIYFPECNIFPLIFKIRKTFGHPKFNDDGEDLSAMETMMMLYFDDDDDYCHYSSDILVLLPY